MHGKPAGDLEEQHKKSIRVACVHVMFSVAGDPRKNESSKMSQRDILARARRMSLELKETLAFSHQ